MDVVGLCGGNHCLAFRNTDGQWFFDKGVFPCVHRPDRKVRVHGIWQGDIDRIDHVGRQKRIIAIVIADGIDPIELCQFCRRVVIAGDNRRHFGVLGLRDRRHQSLLADPSGTDDGVSDLVHGGSFCWDDFDAGWHGFQAQHTMGNCNDPAGNPIEVGSYS